MATEGKWRCASGAQDYIEVRSHLYGNREVELLIQDCEQEEDTTIMLCRDDILEFVQVLLNKVDEIDEYN